MNLNPNYSQYEDHDWIEKKQLFFFLPGPILYHVVD